MSDEEVVWNASRIEVARSEARTERNRLRAEANALEAFAERTLSQLNQLSSNRGRSTSKDHTVLKGVSTPSSRPRTTALRLAYRETVMAVDHFDTDYDEPVNTHMAAEFGDDLATIVCEDRPLSRPICLSIVEATTQRRKHRQSLIEMIESEMEELDRTKDEFQAINRDWRQLPSTNEWSDHETLFAIHETVEKFESQLDQIVSRRQRFLRKTPSGRVNNFGGLWWGEYLYENCDWTFPILSDVADIAARLHDVRTSIGWYIARLDDGYTVWSPTKGERRQLPESIPRSYQYRRS
jgi:hypothetical protein